MPPRILLIDNYDSFVFNLARYLQELGCETSVVRNDELTVAEVRQRAPDAIVLSPGPGTPEQAGICIELVRQFGPTIPMLGVCLGHQAIGAACGGKVIRASAPVHGRTSWIRHHERGLFSGCANPLQVTRYHSLVVAANDLPPELDVLAQLDDGTIMALAHRKWPVYGVQFHPESVLTWQGHQLLQNFLTLAACPTTGQLPREVLPEGPQREDDDFYRRQIDAVRARPL